MPCASIGRHASNRINMVYVVCLALSRSIHLLQLCMQISTSVSAVQDDNLFVSRVMTYPSVSRVIPICEPSNNLPIREPSNNLPIREFAGVQFILQLMDH